MSSLRLLLPSGRALVLLDLSLIAWAVLWVVLGLAIGQEVRGLRQASRTVAKVGVAVEETSAVVATLPSIPLVGDRVTKAARRLREAGRSAARSGRAAKNSARRLSWMLALAIAVIPTVPLIGLYAPLRLAAVRERRSLRLLLARGMPRADLERALAHRAVHTLPYRELIAVSDDPWADVMAGRYRALASAEVARAGLTLPG